MGVVLEKFAVVAAENGVKQSQFDEIRSHIRGWIDRDPLLSDVAMQIKATLQGA